MSDTQAEVRPVDAPPLINTFGPKAVGKTTDALTVAAGNGLVCAQPGATVVAKTVLGVDISNRIMEVDCFERLPDVIYAAKRAGYDAVYVDDGTLLMKRSYALAAERFKKGGGFDFAMYTYLRSLVTNVAVALRWARIPAIITCHDQQAFSHAKDGDYPLGPDLGWSKLVKELPHESDISQYAIGRAGGKGPMAAPAPPAPPAPVSAPPPVAPPAALPAPGAPSAASAPTTAPAAAADVSSAPASAPAPAPAPNLPAPIPATPSRPRTATWDFRCDCPRGRADIATGDRFDVLPEYGGPLNSLMVIREAARLHGYNFHVPRPSGLEWLDEVAEQVAGTIIEEGKSVSDACTPWIRHLQKARVDERHIRWAMRDGIHLSELRRHRRESIFDGML